MPADVVPHIAPPHRPGRRTGLRWLAGTVLAALVLGAAGVIAIEILQGRVERMAARERLAELERAVGEVERARREAVEARLHQESEQAARLLAERVEREALEARLAGAAARADELRAELDRVPEERDRLLATALAGGSDRPPAEPVVARLIGQNEELRDALRQTQAELEVSVAERELARRAERGLRWRVDMLETQLHQVSDRLDLATAELRRHLDGPMAAVLKALRRTGIDTQELLDRVAADGQGGPFVPAHEIVGDPTPLFALALTLDDDLAKLAMLQQLMARLPLAVPMDEYRLSSGFGMRRDPLNRRAAFHAGLDFAGPEGAAIRATGPGTVLKAGDEGAYGIMVEIDHGLGITTRFAHLSAATVEPGQEVAAGEQVGIIGATGRTTGRHLHYEVRLDGRPLDPKRFLEAGLILAESVAD